MDAVAFEPVSTANDFCPSQDFNAAIRKRDTVGTLGLHTLGRNGPYLLLEIDFGPLRAKHLAGATGSQDQVLKCEPRDFTAV